MIIIQQENHYILGSTTTTITASFNDQEAENITIKHIVMTSEHLLPSFKIYYTYKI